MEWMILPFKRFGDFEGRSRRLEYWMFQLLNIIVVFVLMVPLIISLAAADQSSFDSPNPFDNLGVLGILSLVLLGIYSLVILIPGIAVTVRRFHDVGLSGWIYLGLIVAGIIPLIGFIASIAAFVITVLPGNKQANQYGPDPKNPYDEDVFA